MKNAIIRLNDNELLYLISDHSEEAYLILKEKYTFLIRTKISNYNIVNSKWDDYLQEGFMILSKAIRHYDENSLIPFCSYFNLLLTRGFIDLYRKSKLDKKIILSNQLDNYVIDSYNNDYIIEEPKFLSKLEKTVYKMRFIDELKPSIIAKELNIKVRQVYDCVERIKKKQKNYEVH